MELAILDYIQTLRTPLLDHIMVFITTSGNGEAIWILLTILLIIFKKTRKIGIILVVALVIDIVLCNGILNPLIARVRPYDVNKTIELLIDKPADYSFPSGHAASAFTITSALFCMGKKKMSFITGIMACLIAFSRMYLYVHYPSDILAGILLGCFSGWAGYKIVQNRRKDEE